MLEICAMAAAFSSCAGPSYQQARLQAHEWTQTWLRRMAGVGGRGDPKVLVSGVAVRMKAAEEAAELLRVATQDLAHLHKIYAGR
jgi:hypothetical protein